MLHFKRIIQCAFIICLASTLTACGFKLRGVEKLPPQMHTVYLETSTPYGTLAKQLRMSLKYSGVTLVDSADEAPVTLSIVNDNVGASQTSIGSSQETRDYSVNYVVNYVLKDAKGKIIYKPSSVSEQKTITLNEQEVIGNSNKVNEAKQTMLRDIISKIMFQLTSTDAKNALQNNIK